MITTKNGYQLFLEFCIIFIQLWIQFEWVWILKNNLCFLPVFPLHDEIAGKTTKPFFHAFFMKLPPPPFFLFFFGWLSKSGKRQSSGATRAPTPQQLEKGESGGNFLTTNVRPWAWVLQRDVRVGAGVFLIMHLTKAAFQVSRRLMKQKSAPQLGFKLCSNPVMPS